MDDLPRIIILSSTIIDRGNGMIIERDPEHHNRLLVFLPGYALPHRFEGSDAVALWRFFDREPGWRDES